MSTDTLDMLARWMAETVRTNYVDPPPLDEHVREIRTRLKGCIAEPGSRFGGMLWDFAGERIAAFLATVQHCTDCGGNGWSGGHVKPLDQMDLSDACEVCSGRGFVVLGEDGAA